MLPEQFIQRMKQMLGDRAEPLLAELDGGQSVRALRANTVKISVEDFERVNRLDVEKIPYCTDGYYTNEEKLGNTAAHHAGMIYVQDPAAMSTVCCAQIKRGMRVLDACASPGGKSAQLAALVGEDGLVISNEYVSKRASVLQGNMERMGCRSSVVLNLDARDLCKVYSEYFDVAVCDAPCSGEGMFRKNPLAISEWSVENVISCAKRQTEILESVEKCVKAGGQMIYSTCTFSLEENETVVDDFLCRHKNWRLIEVCDGVARATSDGINFDGVMHDMTPARRFYPDVSRGEGQFIALLQKDDGEQDSKAYADLADGADISSSGQAVGRHGKGQARSGRCDASDAFNIEVAKRFIEENLCRIPNKGLTCNGSVVRLCPECVLPEYGVMMCGVCVGEVIKGRLVPHHQFFSAYGNDFKNKIELSDRDPRVEQYIRGLEIDAGDACDGYAAVLYCGCAIGGAKVSGGRAKNHYPKGLRAEI